MKLYRGLETLFNEEQLTATEFAEMLTEERINTRFEISDNFFFIHERKIYSATDDNMVKEWENHLGIKLTEIN